jgi:hypothetical protein
VKSTPVRGVKEILKPHANKRSEAGVGATWRTADGVPFAL